MRFVLLGLILLVSSSYSNPKSSKKGAQKDNHSSTVAELSDNDFRAKVLESLDAWLVEFYSPNCGHCKSFQPEYAKLPKLIGKRVIIGKIDGTKNSKAMKKYKIKGFPTVFLFESGEKKQPILYEGQRNSQKIVEWLKQKKINDLKKEVIKLTQQSYFDHCNKNIVCFIVITTKKLKFLQQFASSLTSQPLQILIVPSVPELETQLMIQDKDPPKLVAIWDSINSFRILKEELNLINLQKFTKRLFQRKGWIKFSKPAQLLLFRQQQL